MTCHRIIGLDDGSVRITMKMDSKHLDWHRQVVIPAPGAERLKQTSLLRAINNTRLRMDTLINGEAQNVTDLSKQLGLKTGCVSRILSLNSLAPDIVEMTGARTYIGAPDRDFVNGKLELPRAKFIDYRYDEPFEPDVLINGGEVLTFGALKIRCEAAPGHTPGTMAFFFDLEENGVVRRAGMHGGVGINSMRTKFLQRFGLSGKCRQQFINGVERLKDEPVEILVGNHLGNYDALGKVRRRQENPGGPNPFVDPAEWKRFLTRRAELVRKLMIEDPAD